MVEWITKINDPHEEKLMLPGSMTRLSTIKKYIHCFFPLVAVVKTFKSDCGPQVIKVQEEFNLTFHLLYAA